MDFTQITNEEFILKAIEKLGFTEPTEIQERSIPIIKSGVDVIGKSKTGSGKTFAFGIPLVEKIDPQNKATQAVIVTPTRELAMQITDELRKLTEFKEGLKLVPLVGGSSMQRQIDALRSGARIIVGTPGRINDHLRRKTLKLKNVTIAVLDEADEMLDMGFKPDVENILNQTNPYRQTVMFSATMPKEVRSLAQNFMKSPEFIQIDPTEENSAVEQRYVYVGEKDKDKALKELLITLNPFSAIVFCNTKKMVDKLEKALKTDGFSAEGLHGEKTQSVRTSVMKRVKNKETAILIATDVAARGIDIKGVDVVINYDIPQQADFYVHRIGRTGRAGKTGESYIILNTKNQLNELDRISRQTKNDIKEFTISISKPSLHIRQTVAKVIPKKATEEKPLRKTHSPKTTLDNQNKGKKTNKKSKESDLYDIESLLDAQIVWQEKKDKKRKAVDNAFSKPNDNSKEKVFKERNKNSQNKRNSKDLKFTSKRNAQEFKSQKPPKAKREQHFKKPPFKKMG